MGKNGARLAVVVILVLCAALVVQRVQLGRAKAAKESADLDAGLAAGRVISDTFSRDASLRVARLTGEVLAQGSCTSGLVFSDEQRTVAPFAAAYAVDLRGIGPAMLRWNAADRVMFVEAPDVVAEAANVDMGRAHSRQTGLFVSRSCGLAMQRQIAGRLQAVATERSLRPDHMAEAREAARTAIARLVSAPLAAAGLGKVEVRVRFPIDAKPVGDRQWDISRSVDDVLHNRY